MVLKRSPSKKPDEVFGMWEKLLPQVTSHRPSQLSSGRETLCLGRVREIFLPESCPITHPRIHTRGKPCACRECGRALSQDKSLIRHPRVHTREEQYRGGFYRGVSAQLGMETCGHSACGSSFTKKSSVAPCTQRFILR